LSSCTESHYIVVEASMKLAVLSPRKAAPHGMISSDGHLPVYPEQGKAHGSYRIVLAEPKLGIVGAFGKEMTQDLLPDGPHGKLKWAAPLRHLNRTSGRAWARSYFDGDGDVHVAAVISKRGVRAKSVNLLGLISVKALLWSFFEKEFKIYRIKKSANLNWSHACELDVIMESSLRFEELDGFNHPASVVSFVKLSKQSN
jgi:hypothetical protein